MGIFGRKPEIKESDQDIRLKKELLNRKLVDRANYQGAIALLGVSSEEEIFDQGAINYNEKMKPLMKKRQELLEIIKYCESSEKEQLVTAYHKVDSEIEYLNKSLLILGFNAYESRLLLTRGKVDNDDQKVTVTTPWEAFQEYIKASNGNTSFLLEARSITPELDNMLEQNKDLKLIEMSESEQIYSEQVIRQIVQPVEPEFLKQLIVYIKLSMQEDDEEKQIRHYAVSKTNGKNYLPINWSLVYAMYYNDNKGKILIETKTQSSKL